MTLKDRDCSLPVGLFGFKPDFPILGKKALNAKSRGVTGGVPISVKLTGISPEITESR
jgi:hypothetical protein